VPYSSLDAPPLSTQIADDTAPGCASTRMEESALIAALAEENERLAAALANSDSRHRNLVATCPLPIYSLDREGRVTEANQAAADVTGRTLEELLGASFHELVAAEDLEAVISGFNGSLTGDGPADIECRLVRPTGERRVVQLTRAAIERDGEIVGVQGIGRDVTEERSRDAQFRRVERMASVAPLLSGVCHELNNPLTSIKSFAEFLLLDERSPEDQEALEIVAREAERAARIVSDLRVVARQSQEAASTCSMVDVNEVVAIAIDSRRSTLESEGIEIRLDLKPDLIPAWAVRPQVEQVLAHLLTNAVQAMRDQEQPRCITVSTFPGDLGVVLQVADTGPGIRPEDHNRIFDPFWTTKEPGEGTGLGLSLVNSIVTDHGGRIRVDSHAGRGATFIVDLPAAEQAPTVTDPGVAQVAARRSLRVLVVDDEAPIRTSLTRYLERRGHTVQQADEGRAALALLGVSTNDAPFDIIVADLRMPGLDGQRFVAELRQRSDGLEHRVIFITGDAESPDVEQFLRDSGAPVVWKPFELAEVAQIVEAHAGMSVP
jgi:PAS domain S-box-containing protein